MAKKQEVKQEVNENLVAIADIVDSLKQEKTGASLPPTFSGILTDKVEKTKRGIRVFVKLDGNKTYHINLARKDVVDLYDNGFFGKRVTCTREEATRTWTVELA